MPRIRREESPGPVPVEDDRDLSAATFLPAEPPGQLDGIDELGPLRCWISLDGHRGVFVCKTLSREFTELVGVIKASRVVRTMKDENGMVLCASTDRLSATEGRPGRCCETCEDRGEACMLHWWIALEEEATGLVFAHTLSNTGTINFQRFANVLLREQLLPSQVRTRLFVEEARRLKTNTLYRRIQFERLDAADAT